MIFSQVLMGIRVIFDQLARAVMKSLGNRVFPALWRVADVVLIFQKVIKV